MPPKTKNIRSFFGTPNFEESRAFYRALGLQEYVIGDKMVYFEIEDDIGFYLQDYYVKDWVDNSMMFIEVEDLRAWSEYVASRNVAQQFPAARISEIKNEAWGDVIYMHDPSGVLWHIAHFPT